MSAACSFDALCSKLAAQHSQFLTEASQKAFEALKRENERLTEENTQLRHALGDRASNRKAPPVPPVPSALRKSPGSCWVSDGPISMGHPLRQAPTDKPPWMDFLRVGDCHLPGEVPSSPPETCMLSCVKGASPKHRNIPGASDEAHRRRRTEIKRLRRLLEVGKYEDEVYTDALVRALRTRERSFHLTRNQVQVVVAELNSIAGRPSQKDQISFEVLLDLVNDDSVMDQVHDGCKKDTNLVVAALRNPTIEEIVDTVSRSIADGEKKEDPNSKAWERPLNALVMTVVGVNILALAISVDHSPSHFGWFILEAVCVSVFLAELVIKIFHLGVREFFCGQDSVWNTTDSVVTVISVMELSLSFVEMLMVEGIGEGWMVASAMRVAVMLRALRFVRVIRLLRLVDSPLLRDLANMLVGFVIGIPSLVWVLAFISMVLFLVGLFFRMVFGPSEGQDLIYRGACGLPDDWSSYADLTCKVSHMYGEEFFGTTWKSMFTLFRFMLGDYSTRGGKSLIIAFSQDYGAKFDVLFMVWMTMVIFGLFNIITSAFVETTMAGLKHNDVKRKYAMQYQKKYVQAKLTKVLSRIRDIHFEHDTTPSDNKSLDFYEKTSKGFTEEEYMRIMDDDDIKQLLEDLDIDVLPLASLFDTFDADETGLVSVQELVEGIMKLRGDPQKSDIIGCWVATRLLHGKVDQVLAAVAEDKLRGSAVADGPGAMQQPQPHHLQD